MRGLEILDPISVGHDTGLIRCETDPGMSLPGSRDHHQPIRGQYRSLRDQSEARQGTASHGPDTR